MYYNNLSKINKWIPAEQPGATHWTQRSGVCAHLILQDPLGA